MSTTTPSRKKTTTTPSSGTTAGSMIKRVSAATPSSSTKPSPGSRSSSASPPQTGNGGSTNSVKKWEEQQCLLRVPLELANRINKILQQHDASKDANKQIELDIDLVFGDNEEILQFLKSAMKQQPQQQPQQDTNNTNTTNFITPANGQSTTSNQNKQASSSSSNGNSNEETDQGYISDIEYTIKKNRRGRFRFGQEQYPCELLDLPCIVEAYKSIDCQTYYKAGEVSQMILVKSPETVDREMRKLKLEDDEMKRNTALKKLAKNKKHKKLRKRMLTVSEHGLTPSTRNITRHWEEQNIDVSKADIALMVDQFMKMMEEEDPNNVTIEILEDKDEEETFSDDTSSSEESDSDTDTSESEDEDSDRDEEEMAAIFGQSSNPPTPMDNQLSVASPSISSSSPMLGMKEQSNLSEDSLSAHSDDDDTASVTSSLRSGGVNFATALASRGGNFSSPIFGSPLNVSTPPGTSKSPSSVADDDAKSTITSDDDDEEMFESVMNEESNLMEEEEEEEDDDSVSSPISETTTTASTADRHRLIERRNALLGELAEKQRELAEKERHYSSIPNAILKQRFAGQITEKQKEIEQKRNELDDIDRQLN